MIEGVKEIKKQITIKQYIFEVILRWQNSKITNALIINAFIPSLYLSRSRFYPRNCSFHRMCDHYALYGFYLCVVIDSIPKKTDKPKLTESKS